MSDLSPALAQDTRFSALCTLAEEIFDELDYEAVLVYLIDLVNSDVFPFLAELVQLNGRRLGISGI